jgi:hypothetical protein
MANPFETTTDQFADHTHGRTKVEPCTTSFYMTACAIFGVPASAGMREISPPSAPTSQFPVEKCYLRSIISGEIKSLDHPHRASRLQAALQSELYRAVAELTVIRRYWPDVRIQTTIDGPDLSSPLHATVIHRAELSQPRKDALQYAAKAMRAIEDNPDLTLEDFLRAEGDIEAVEIAFWAARDGYEDFRQTYEREIAAATARLGTRNGSVI